MDGQAMAMAVDLIAGPDAPQTCRCMCVWCAMDMDPGGEASVHRAPASSECWRCGDERRERDGMLFLVLPKGGGA